MAYSTTTLERGDKPSYRVHPGTLPFAHVDLVADDERGPAVITQDPDALDALAEACLAAARDLRIAQAPSLGSLIDSDDTSQAAKYLEAKRAQRGAA